MIIGLDHVQFTVSRTLEAEARRFYLEVLGFGEFAKPEVLQARGGFWCRSGAAVVHIGLEEGVRHSSRAHSAFLVQTLDEVAGRLEAAGYPVTLGDQIPGYRRFETRDPGGNRIEFMEATF